MLLKKTLYTLSIYNTQCRFLLNGANTERFLQKDLGKVVTAIGKVRRCSDMMAKSMNEMVTNAPRSAICGPHRPTRQPPTIQDVQTQLRRSTHQKSKWPDSKNEQQSCPLCQANMKPWGNNTVRLLWYMASSHVRILQIETWTNTPPILCWSLCAQCANNEANLSLQQQQCYTPTQMEASPMASPNCTSKPVYNRGHYTQVAPCSSQARLKPRPLLLYDPATPP